MDITSINSIGSNNAMASQAAASLGGDILGKGDFLTLLVTQIQNQDPLNPMNNEEFIAQLTQFSILEENQNLNKSITGLLTKLDVQTAATMIGKEVTYVEPQTGTTGSGIISKVTITNTGPAFEIDGKLLPMSAITSVSQVAGNSANTAGETTGTSTATN